MLEQLLRGAQLPLPLGCPEDVYAHVMQPCWVIDPMSRPPASELLALLDAQASSSEDIET